MKKYSIELDETFLDYPDPEGTAIIFFLSGCLHNCLGCQNPELQKPVEYTETPEELCKRIIDFSQRCQTNKIVISGGDPLSPCNRNLTAQICSILGSTHDICIYTGYSHQEVKNMQIKGYKYVKCGRFDIRHKQKSYKDDEKMQFASPNQELYLFGNDVSLTKNGVFYFNEQARGK